MSEIERNGFIPNGETLAAVLWSPFFTDCTGARTYYLNRSQPPLFTFMVSLYVDSTGDEDILERALPAIETEYALHSFAQYRR